MREASFFYLSSSKPGTAEESPPLHWHWWCGLCSSHDYPDSPHPQPRQGLPKPRARRLRGRGRLRGEERQGLHQTLEQVSASCRHVPRIDPTRHPGTTKVGSV